MNAVKIYATWQEREGTRPHPRDDPEKKRTQSASRVFMRPIVKLAQCRTPEPKSHEVLIRVRACGICGSDVGMANADADGYAEYPFMMKSPIIPGHEFSGEIVAVGSKVLAKRPELSCGTPVVAQCVVNCGLCKACSNDKSAFCAYAEEQGFTVDGAMAEYCVADMRQVHSIRGLIEPTHTKPLLWRPAPYTAEHLYRAGSLIEPLSGTFKAITEHSAFEPGDAVLVTGAGPIGVAAMLVFRTLGAGKVFIADKSLPRLRRAARSPFSADGIIDMTLEKLEETVLDATHGEGVKVIFEATGAVELFFDQITALLKRAPGGSCVFFGQSKKVVPFDPQLFIQQYITFSGSHGHSGVWPQVIALVAAGRIKPLEMITREIALSEAPDWLAKLPEHREELKVTITKFV